MQDEQISPAKGGLNSARSWQVGLVNLSLAARDSDSMGGPHTPTGVPRSKETAPSQVPTVELCLGSYGGPTGGAVPYERGTPAVNTREVAKEMDRARGRERERDGVRERRRGEQRRARVRGPPGPGWVGSSPAVPALAGHVLLLISPPVSSQMPLVSRTNGVCHLPGLTCSFASYLPWR